MQYFPAALQNLADQFARLPGIGGKTAQRLAFYVLGLPAGEAQAFADAIVEAKKTVHTCPVCQKAKILSYGASGKISSHCPICRRTIMWDFDSHKAYPISNYPSNNLKCAN